MAHRTVAFFATFTALLTVGCGHLPERIEVMDASTVGYDLKREALLDWDEMRSPLRRYEAAQWVKKDEEGKPTATGCHLAVVAQEGGKEYVVYDGQAGPKFDQIGDLGYSEDGNHLAYTARNGSKWCVVLDGKPQEEFDGVGVWFLERDSSGYQYPKVWLMTFLVDAQEVYHLVYAGRKGDRRYVVVDGELGPGFEAQIVSVPTLSPDARHVSYIVQQQVSQYPAEFKYFHVLDGKAVAECDQFMGLSPHFVDRAGRIEYFTGNTDGTIDHMTLTPREP